MRRYPVLQFLAQLLVVGFPATGTTIGAGVDHDHEITVDRTVTGPAGAPASDTHPVSVASETVEVLPEETPGPTTTPPPGDDGEITRSETTGEGDVTAGTGTGSTGASGPGPGIAALALLAVVLARRI